MEKRQDKWGLETHCILSQVSFFLFFFIYSLIYVIYRLKMTMATTINTATTIPITHDNTGYDPPQQVFLFILHLMGAGDALHLQPQVCFFFSHSKFINQIHSCLITTAPDIQPNDNGHSYHSTQT